MRVTPELQKPDGPSRESVFVRSMIFFILGIVVGALLYR